MAKLSFITRLAELLYVPKCLGCGDFAEDGAHILCRICRTKYELLCHRKCLSCGLDICGCGCTKEGIAAHGVWRLSKLCAYVPQEKHNPLIGMLYAFKNKNNRDIRNFFADELVRQIKQKCPEYKSFSVCYVPRSTASLGKYGYDHMKVFARCVADRLGIECVDAFYRSRVSRVQKELDRKSRFENADKSILLCGGAEHNGCRYILLDDVCVTGASLGRCASLLISDGAREVRSFVIASRP